MDDKINTRDILEQTLPEIFEPAGDYPNFNRKLLVEMFLAPDEKLKKDAFVILGLWSSTLNFECYTKDYFPDMFFEACESLDISAVDSDKYSKFKNHVLKIELKGIEEHLQELKEIFTRYHFPHKPRMIREFLNKGKLEPENEEFLNILKKENIDIDILEPLIKNRLSEIGKLDLMYLLSFIYFDSYKLHQYLVGELDPSIPDEVEVGKSKSETTATQWALYHYVLQKAKIKPWFVEKKKEFKQLEKEYGKHWNNLQGRWNLINNSQGQEGYSIKDLNAVEGLLNSNHPEAVHVLKEISSKLF